MPEGIRRYPGPGKYEGEPWIASYVHLLALEGPDDEAGSVADVGEWCGLLRGSLLEEELVKEWEKQEGTRMTPEERDLLRRAVGAIICEDDLGFVDVTIYGPSEKRKMERRWRHLARVLELEEAE